jgi:hypothetical protein
MITIEVTNANGRTCEVHISWGDYSHSSGLTDSNGRVRFDASPGQGKILVDGQEVYSGPIGNTQRVQKK